MTLMRSLFEKVKPYFSGILLVLVCILLSGNLLQSCNGDDYRRDTERINDLTVEISSTLGDIVREVSELKNGITELEGTVSDLERTSREVEDAVDRIAEANLDIGDSSTEIAITSDRAYRLTRELAERY